MKNIKGKELCGKTVKEAAKRLEALFYESK